MNLFIAPYQHRQTGSVMLSAIVVVAILSIFTGAFFQATHNSEITIRNQTYYALALNDAEAALRYGEHNLAELTDRPDKKDPFSGKQNPPPSGDSGGSGGSGDSGDSGGSGSGGGGDLAGKLPNIWANKLTNYNKGNAALAWYKQMNSWWDNNAAKGESLHENSGAAYYVIEEIYQKKDDLGSDPQYNPSSGVTVYYRISSRGTSGPSGTATSTLQSVYAKSFN